MALRAMWVGRRWRRVYEQLNGTIIAPSECRCCQAVSGVMVWDPLLCPIDDHQTHYMQAEDPLALRDRCFPEIDWEKSSDMRDQVEIEVAATFRGAAA